MNTGSMRMTAEAADPAALKPASLPSSESLASSATDRSGARAPIQATNMASKQPLEGEGTGRSLKTEVCQVIQTVARLKPTAPVLCTSRSGDEIMHADYVEASCSNSRNNPSTTPKRSQTSYKQFINNFKQFVNNSKQFQTICKTIQTIWEIQNNYMNSKNDHLSQT